MTPAFKKWFGDSKVVDANGKPLRLFHWTPKNFSKFKAGGLNPKLSGKAIWLALDPGMMNAAHNLSSQLYKNGVPLPEYRSKVMLPELGEHRYVWEGVNVMPLYARIEYPLEQTLQLLPRR